VIKFSNTLKDFLSRSAVSGFYLISVGNTYMTNYFIDVTVGGHVYVKDSPIVSVQPPQQTSSVDSQKYMIAFADPSFALGFMAESNLVGMPVDVRICIINPDTGVPFTSELIQIYKGKVSDAAYKVETGELGSAIFQLTCSSPMGNLDLTKNFLGNKSFIRERIDSTDAAFDQIYEGGSKVRVRWGKL